MTEDLKVLDEMIDVFIKMAQAVDKLKPKIAPLIEKYGLEQFARLLYKRVDEREDVPDDMRINPAVMVQAFMMGAQDTQFKESGV